MNRVTEIISALQGVPEDAIPVMGVWNGHVETYGVIDHVLPLGAYGSSIYNDLYGTPGSLDDRLLPGSVRDDTPVVYLGSRFPGSHSTGDEPVPVKPRDYNGPAGDPDLPWKLSGFKETGPGLWELRGPWGTILYNTGTYQFHAKSVSGSSVFLVDPSLDDIQASLEILGIRKEVHGCVG